jgi:hypothetical protein
VLDGAFAFTREMEIVTDDDVSGIQAVNEDAPDKIGG